MSLGPQIAVNALLSASLWLLVGIGFSLIYTTARFFNFAHGAFVVLGAYFAYGLNSWFGLNRLSASALALALSCVAGLAMEAAIYAPLRRRNASSLTLLLVSLGLYVSIQNIIAVVFGDDAKGFRSDAVPHGLMIAGARMTLAQLWTLGATAIITLLFFLVLQFTSLGRQLRAVASDPELAAIRGVNVRRLALFAFGFGSTLSAFAGVTVLFDVGIVPTIGQDILLMAVVASVVGGVTSFFGLVAAVLTLGFAYQFGAFLVGSQWRECTAFVILFAILLFRPQGFCGTRSKREAL